MTPDAIVDCGYSGDGGIAEPPVPRSSLFIDEDGRLDSTVFDEAWRRYGFRRFHARYSDLETEFDEWRRRASGLEVQDGPAGR